ncbi:unnamed protein product [Protopolystoma xenopodis]|uniref:Uncharacterized protein n=1 Tax=Protopolystoma xenopodis TaxID=117903 RepID=A0A448XLT0_9PLAT|nr:unnamed protein product [Protopolystoma xenopodis]
MTRLQSYRQCDESHIHPCHGSAFVSAYFTAFILAGFKTEYRRVRLSPTIGAMARQPSSHHVVTHDTQGMTRSWVAEGPHQIAVTVPSISLGKARTGHRRRSECLVAVMAGGLTDRRSSCRPSQSNPSNHHSLSSVREILGHLTCQSGFAQRGKNNASLYRQISLNFVSKKAFLPSRDCLRLGAIQSLTGLKFDRNADAEINIF